MDLTQLRDELRAFAGERDWDQFHTPKNLASALSVEAAELLEPFQWLKTGELSELDERTRGSKPKPQKFPSSQIKVSHERVQVDHLAIALEGVMPVEQDVPPSCR